MDPDKENQENAEAQIANAELTPVAPPGSVDDDTHVSEPSSQEPAADLSSGESDAPKEKSSMLSAVERILGLGKKDDDKDAGKNAQAASEKDGGEGEKPPAGDAVSGTGEGPASGEGDGAKVEEVAPVPKEIAEHPAYQDLQKQTEEYKASHERMAALNDFMQTNNLTPDDMTGAINQAAVRAQSGIPATEFQRADQLTLLAHSKPEEFYNHLVKMTEEYGVFLGKALPADLQKDVDEGNISVERAQELSKARIEKQVSDRRAEMATNRESEVSASTAAKNQGEIVSRWFDHASKTDIELPHKVNAIEGEMLRLLNERARKGQAFDNSEKAVFDLLNEAHKNVTKNMRQGKARAPVDPAPRSNPAPVNTEAHQDLSPQERMVSDVQQIMNRHTG